MSTEQPSEEQLREMYEEQMRRIRVEDVLMNSVVELINQGMRRTGLAQGYEGDRDPEQVRLAIEAVRILMPLAESITDGEQLKPFRDALSQLQLAYVRIGGAPSETPGAEPAAPKPPASSPAGEPPKPGETGAAQRSGRLWIPGQ
jgi:hypothetical protein